MRCLLAFCLVPACTYELYDDLEAPQQGRDAADAYAASRAQEYLARCDAGEAVFCAGLGDLYRMGLGVDQDEERATELHAKACAGGVTTSCTPVGD